MAIREGDVVVLACDSAATDDSFEHSTRDGCSKGWVQSIKGIGSVLLGFSGNYAAGLWIRHGFSWPVKPSSMTIEAYLVASAQPALYKSLRQRFENETDENRTSWEVLFAIPHRIFKLRPDGDVECCKPLFAAIGDAGPTALGSLHATVGTRPSWESLELAFQACFECRASVRGPLHMLALGTHGIMHSQEENAKWSSPKLSSTVF